jgi:hypothetical protein
MCLVSHNETCYFGNSCAAVIVCLFGAVLDCVCFAAANTRSAVCCVANAAVMVTVHTTQQSPKCS